MPTIFAHPERLWLLLGVLPLAAWRFRGSRLRSREWAELAQSGPVPGDGSRGWLLAMVLVVLALGQPRWGRLFGQEAPLGHDLVLVVDVSRSMGAEDAVPNRLGVAIDSASSLLKALEGTVGNRVAVVAFAGRGVVRCPLTSSLDSAGEILKQLQVGEIVPGGTDLGAALETALGTFDDEEHADGRTIVVFSDGEDHVGSWVSLIDRLRASRVIVHAVAIGDPVKGFPVPSSHPLETPSRTPPDETRRSDVAFEKLAKATGGAMIPLGLAPADLGSLFRDKIDPTARTRREALPVPERVERFPGFLLLALVCGLVSSWPGLDRRGIGRVPMAAAAVILVLASLGAGSTGDPARWISQGQKAYAERHFAEALDAFEKAISAEPKAAVPRYDAASALFQLRRFPEALARYEEALERADAGLAIKIEYALGNTRLALGDIPGAVASYDACLASELPGKAFDAVREDARENREFAVKRLPPEPEPSEGGGPNPSGSKRPRPRPGRPDGDPGDRDPSSPSPSPDPGTNPERKSDGNGTNRSGGGAGGSSSDSTPPEGSPDARLNEALKNLKEARSRRPGEPPPSGPKGTGKDW